MMRSSLRLWATTGVLLAFIACAKAEDGDAPLGGDGDGDGGGNPMNTGGISTSSGGVVIGASGGSSSTSGGSSPGGTNSGGMMNLGGESPGSGGASTGGAPTGTGGAPLGGECAGVGGLASVTAQGDVRVYTCPKVQSNCPAEALNEPALFECVSDHLPNCTGQAPDDTPSWSYLGLCTDTGMGGADN